jgi:hypothetical protein
MNNECKLTCYYCGKYNIDKIYLLPKDWVIEEKDFFICDGYVHTDLKSCKLICDKCNNVKKIIK